MQFQAALYCCYFFSCESHYFFKKISSITHKQIAISTKIKDREKKICSACLVK
jgi:hypothetical protein